jgi:glyceraldehyde-3-phosphate dehydrogenase (NAD(P))
MAKVRVGVNGYGVIGKRVADAVGLQSDMTLVGAADVAADYRMQVGAHRGVRLFGSTDDAVVSMTEAGLDPAGGLDELLQEVDVIIDTTPKRVGAANKVRYEAAGVKSVFQGGESHDLTGFSFVAQANYTAALGRDTARVVSCNTTALVRVLGALRDHRLLGRARAVLLRRATDPWESHLGGMINTVLPETTVPSHQGPDAGTVLADLDLITVAAAAPVNLGHIHFLTVEAEHDISRDDVIAALASAPRVAFVQSRDGVAAPNSIIEIARDLGRPRADVWEVAVWEDILAVHGREIFLTYMVHNESIVVPENVDAIRALTGIEPDASASIRQTDTTLGIRDTLP